ncbi:transporter substrate-binding domain-containing protein [Pedobacter cryoconitis]|uniref:Cyclohexadienyl dehydratase n=1 Tax=Pedobacter cryoconitis TaxID=188932 RepID=A0A7X0MKZ1_9SPHI|nr:transporter substrate-binding domain-containing protein [Pedobacter cryoconitis]MBB6502561.1 cyclohexadienyl dehydratase [Pedobacter cryoconitis]
MKPITRYLLFCLLLLATACNSKLTPAGQILIGTTGDYPPLTSFDTASKQFIGEDIELALRLGRHLGKRVVFVKTTWKDLNADLLAKKFDLAIGGISINAARQKSFIFSAPLLMDRKVAIFRKQEQSKFVNFQAIDQAGIRIIENIGGTNEQFARKHIHQATLNVIPDNQQVFITLLNSGADVMFTDETEAKYQQQKHPELSWIRLDENTSPPYAKAIMFNQADTLLRRQVNSWLKK